MSYKLLILRTHWQYTGRVWLAYDKAFREHAVATKLVDWSSLNVQLYSLSTAGASVRGGPDGLFSDLPEPFRATLSNKHSLYLPLLCYFLLIPELCKLYTKRQVSIQVMPVKMKC